MPEYLPGIVEPNQEAQQLATDFAFTEGPLWHPDGYWLFVDLRREPPVIHRMSPAGGTPEIIREPSGGTNGMTLDLQGRLLMCEGDNRRIARMESDGTINVVADRWDGKRFHRPNDIVCRSDGSIYFTNPSGRVPEEEQEIEWPGTIHRIAPDGTVDLSAHDIDFPNGIAFSPDEIGAVCVQHAQTRRTARPVLGRRGQAEPVHPGLRRGRRRIPKQQPRFRQHGFGRGRRARRHEGGRGRPGVLHRFRRRVGLLAGRRASGHHPRPRDTGQLRLRRPGTSGPCSSPPGRRCTACA